MANNIIANVIAISVHNITKLTILTLNVNLVAIIVTLMIYKITKIDMHVFYWSNNKITVLV